MRKARARFIGAAEWHQIAQALAAAFAEIEHPRAAGNELRGKLRTSIRNGDSADTAGLVRYRFEREICVDVKGHVDLPVLMAGPSTNRRLSARRTSARRFKRTATVVNEGLIPPSAPESRARLFQRPAEPDGGNFRGEAGAVGLHGQRAHRRRASRRLEFCARNFTQESVERLVLAHADDAVEIAGHTDIGDEGGAAGENAMVGGRRVRVRADDKA